MKTNALIQALGRVKSSAMALTLWAFYNVIQFSCKNLANQILLNSRLNWITL
jgi:hypothetical protein